MTMENRFLCRGKRIDNGEWEIGSLIALPDGKFEIANNCENPPDSDPMWEKCVITHEVEPTTICQCTGLRDKNDALIWENDILMAYLDEDHPEDVTYAKIEWNGSGWSTHENNNEDQEYLDDFVLENYEVVGNIFDNPGLLEV